jgi:ribosomal protein S8
LEKKFHFIEVFLNNFLLTSNGKPCLKSISIESKPVQPIFVNKLGFLNKNVSYSFLKSNKNIVYFLSTSKGILPHYLCKKLGIGGKVLFKII